jgi:hypothetical protein
LLDLRNSEEGKRLLKDAKTMFDLGATMFDLGLEELHKYAYNPPKSLLGYGISIRFTAKSTRHTQDPKISLKLL